MTTELWRVDDDGGMVWRLSMADVAASGPFSRFEGVDRVIGHLEGAAMRLKGTTSDVTLIPGLTFAFSGEEAIEALIDKPCRDFNLMLRRGAASGDFAFASQSEKTLASGETAFIYALENGVRVNGEVLQHHDLALLSAGALTAKGDMIIGSVHA